jgi:hypothetical protein
MPEEKKIRMNVSIASASWAFQPGQVVSIDADTADKWIRGGHAQPVGKNTPVSNGDLLADLDAESALRHHCSSCEKRRARFVLRNRAYCPQCFRAAMEGSYGNQNSTRC